MSTRSAPRPPPHPDRDAAGTGRLREGWALRLLDASPDWVNLLTPDGRLEYVGRAGRCLMEFEELEAVRDAHWPTLWPGAGATAAAEAIAVARAGGTGRFDGFCPTVRGTPKWWAVTVTAVRDEAGATVALLAVAHDVTEQRAAAERLRHDASRFRAFVEQASDALFLLDAAGRFTYVSPSTERAFGYAPAELVGTSAFDIVHGDDVALATAALARAFAAPGTVEQAELRARHADGGWRTVEARGRAFDAEAEGAPDPASGLPLVASGVLVVLRDVTARADAERALRESEERFRTLSTASPIGIFHSDRLGHITYANPRLLRLWAMPEQVALGTGWMARVHPEDRPALAEVWAAARAADREYEHEYRLLMDDGSMRHVRANAVPLRDASGTTIGRVGTVVDVTERTQMEAALVRQAFHDALTGLPNRARFHECVGRALADGDHAAAVLFVDLDGFKAVNDSFGHAIGDRLLGMAAERLLHATRGSDTVARLGGDEFAILLADVGAAADAILIAERVVAGMARPFALAGREVRMGASVGIAVARAGDSTDDLLRNADLAMYGAKSDGRGRWRVFAPEMHATAVDRLTLEGDLRRAVDAGQCALHFQPIVCLATRTVIGVETLARWTHATRGAIPPATFIPIAEESGTIVALGRWVLEAACREAVRWPARDAPPGCDIDGQIAPAVTVNVSARQWQDPQFPEHVRAALAASGLEPRRLILEITESVIMRDSAAMQRRIEALRALGVRLAIDDFGTGFSSLAYLQRFPVDVLKIDRSFVARIGAGDREAALAGTIVGLASALGLRTVAEGVETPEQAERLHALGCRLAQGYHFARPLPAEEARALILGGVVPVTGAGARRAAKRHAAEGHAAEGDAAEGRTSRRDGHDTTRRR